MDAHSPLGLPDPPKPTPQPYPAVCWAYAFVSNTGLKLRFEGWVPLVRPSWVCPLSPPGVNVSQASPSSEVTERFSAMGLFCK